jgi:membrane protein
MTSPTGKVLAVVPHRLRAPIVTVLNELLRVQIFDRSMTLAAQAFTSIFPLLIMVSTLAGGGSRRHLGELVRLPDVSARLLDDALDGSRSNAFGLVGGLIVILSATGLARALVRSYRTVWQVPGRRTGAAATGWQIGTVLLLVGFLIAIRLLSSLTGMLPAPRAGQVVVTALADLALAALLPRILLGPVVPWTKLLLTGALFAVAMVGVRAGGAIYLPRALTSSADRYGTIGLAFTYIGWLYVLSFCLLLTAILAGVLHPPDQERQDQLADAGGETAGAGQDDEGRQRQVGQDDEGDPEQDREHAHDHQGGP